MTQPHRIHTASLTLDFRHESEAERFERDAPRFVQQQLLPLIDALFDQFSPPHQLWVIDQLSFDLGALPASDLESALLAALQRQLTEALRARPPSAPVPPPENRDVAADADFNADIDVDAAEIQVLDGAAAQWRQLQFFLQHGVIPWHYPGRQGWRQADTRRHWLADAVRRHPTPLNRLLSASANPAGPIARLVSQLPASALNGWLEQLTPAYQDIALRCLAAQPEPEAMPAALRARLHRHWHQRIHQALRQRRLQQELLPVWGTLLGDQRTRFLLALYACGQQPEVVRGIAQAVDDGTFDDLLRLLAPQAQPFIQQVLRHPAWFRHPDAAAVPADPSGPLDQLLREFTLHYLLVQRGSQFNKQRYMAGLVGRMAAHHNMERTDLLQTLYLRLAAWPGDHALKQPLLSLLTTLWGEIAWGEMAPRARALPRLPGITPGAQPERRRPVAGETAGHRDAVAAETAVHTLRQQWADALHQADDAALNRVWRQCTPAMLLTLRPALTACGQQSQVRQRWVVRFSAATQYRLLTLLEPADAPFIRELMDDVRASQPAIAAHCAHAPGEPLLTHSLWSLTFSYLLAERGSEFNRQSYLNALLRQLAAHHNLSRQALIDALLQRLRHTPADTVVRRALLTLLSRLRESDPPAPQTQPQRQSQPQPAAPCHIDADLPPPAQPLLDAACYHYLYEVLVHGDPTRRFVPPDQAQTVWRAASSYAGADLLRCLQQLQAHHPLLIQRWLAVSTHHPASWLRLCAALRPSQAAQLLAQLVALRQPAVNLHSLTTTLDNVTRRLTVAQRQAFYGQMIDALAANRTPDWLAIRDAVSQSAPPSAVVPYQPVSAATPDSPTPSAMDDASALALLQRIAEHAPAMLAADDIAALAAALARLLPSQPEAVRRFLLPALQSADMTERLADALPDTLHTALLLLLRRSDFLALHPYGRFIANLCHRHPAYHGASQALESLLWRALYHSLFAAGSPTDIAAFISHYLGKLAADWQQRSRQPSPAAFYRFLLQQAQAERLAATRTLTDRLQRLITAAGLDQDTPAITAVADADAVADSGQPSEHDIAAAATPDMSVKDMVVSDMTAPVIIDWRGDETLPTDEPVSIANAGLVLAAPWLPRLLARLALVRDGAFPQPDARYQAIHCLQYLVDQGRNCAEYQLALNKLLCGLPLNAPLALTIPPDAAARDTLDALLAAILQHWNVLGHTSVDGLRQTFLQREGTLWRQADSWKLEVVAGPFDMLLDRLPWGYSTIKYPWMDRPLHVVWR
ncbi:contractile injection system tape measure protein [Dickeya dianthicola]|uniref:contractile injection system tape measure protein n=1 Tax=Dickeya dianthicola TaxID=204039 RepID=UPI001F613D01|nr:contractile injection system tape measure protein [Dickeya dianthicola]MCI4185085.1 contractile injection system tape measure protein [Dickeya dianthicola]